MIKLYRIVLCAAVTASLFAACKKSNDKNPAPEPKPKPESVKTLDSISFSTLKNPALKQSVKGEIIGDTVFVSTFAGTDLSALKPKLSFKGAKITVNNTTQLSELTINNFTAPVKYTITGDDNTTKQYVVKFISTGLPTMYISTNDVAIESKDIYVTGNIKIAGDIAGTVLYDGKTEIKGRGNSTWNMPKKPYRIKLDKKAVLLGMPENKNWVLLANYADKSLMRNELAFELSKRAGLVFTPNSRYVEVVLNGAYMGNYMLTEQVKEGKQQVNIEEQAKGTVTEPDITGGYLLEADGFAEGEPVYFYTAQGMPVTIKYPDDGDINQAQKDYIINHYKKFEDALFSTGFADPTTGYRKYFDVDSYVNYYLVNEIMGNSDMFWSTYMYKKRGDDKLYTGPVWDFDIAINNDDRLGNAVNKLMYTDGHNYKIWINRLMQDKTFRQKIRSRWNELKTTVLTMPAFIDQVAQKLAISQSKNFSRWNILSTKVYREYYIAGSYSSEIQFLKTNLGNRINWLDTQFNSADYQ